MASKRYQRLRSQVQRLKKTLLPREINKDLLELSPRVSVRALSFRIFCHAEIEQYLEDRCTEIAAAADNAWKARQHICRATLCLLAFSGKSLDKLPDTLRAPPKKKQSDWQELIKPDKRLSHAITTYRHNIQTQNHGIKESNLISMLLPIGLDPDILDEVLISDMNDFSIKRGEAAHGSVLGQLTRGINPRDEYQQVFRIIDGLKPIDLALNNILKETE